MSKASEDKFDQLVEQAHKTETCQLDFLIVLPSGKAVHVEATMMPEELEEIGEIPLRDDKDVEAFTLRMADRGVKMAALFNRKFNPMLSVLLEAAIREHYEAERGRKDG